MKIINKNTLLTFITLLIVIISFNFIDKPLTLYISNANLPAIVTKIAKLISIIFDTKIWILLGFVLLFSLIFRQTQAHKREILTVSLSIIATAVIITILKIVLARYRPMMLIDKNLYGFHFFSKQKLLNSMPSGHTSLTFAGLISFALAMRKRSILIVCVFIGILVAVSRIVIFKHYLSDVLLGAYIGSIIAIYFNAFLKKN